jgi:VanZ family protein
MMRTGVLSPSEEHFLAYMLSGLLVAAAMPRYRFVRVACFYVLLAGVLELGQNFIPGRDPEALAAFVSMCGAIVGEVVARLISGSWRERLGLPALLIAPARCTTSPPCPSVSPS